VTGRSREREEDHEPGEDREPAGENSQDAGCTIAVLEVAALRRAAPDEEHRGDRTAVTTT
jgi:hypothetical protein